MRCDETTRTPARRWWHHPISFSARLRIAGALMVTGLITGVVQLVGLEIVGLVALMFGVILNPILILLLLLEFGASGSAARAGSPSYLHGGMLGMFTGVVLSILVMAYLSTWVSHPDPFGASALIWFALPIIATLAGCFALVGTIAGSRRGKAVQDDSLNGASAAIIEPLAGTARPRRRGGLTPLDILVPCGLLVFGLSYIYLDVDIDSLTPYLIVIPILCLMITACVLAMRPRSSFVQRGGLIGAGIGSVLACITVVQMVDSSDPFASGLSFMAAPPLVAFLIGGGALLGITVGLGIQLARGR